MGLLLAGVILAIAAGTLALLWGGWFGLAVWFDRLFGESEVGRMAALMVASATMLLAVGFLLLGCKELGLLR